MNFGSQRKVLAWSNDSMDGEPLSPYFGGCPDRMYWSAIRRVGTRPETRWTRTTRVLAIFPTVALGDPVAENQGIPAL